MALHNLPRYCHASSSRIPLYACQTGKRRISFIPRRPEEPVPFFIPPFKPPIGFTPRGYPISYGIGSGFGRGGKGKGREPEFPKGEEEVDDREWEIRSARAMLHLRDTLPKFFNPDQSTSTLFPPDIFSQNVTLKLSHPIPLKISSLGAYSMAFAIARNGMQALHSDLDTKLDRMTFTLSPRDIVNQEQSLVLSRKPIPPHRYKQIRVQVSVRGTVRLPPHHEAVWQTSSLYTLSPCTGLIISHEVESIRPLPGEGVAEWLKSRVLGWTSAQKDHENLPNIPCPRTQALPVRTSSEQGLRSAARYIREKNKDHTE